MVFILPRDIQQIDPRLTGDAFGLKVSRLIFASLVTIDPHSLEPIVDLAEHVEVVSPTLYRVKIKKGLKFSDGSELDAEDIVATFRSVVAPEISSRYARTYQRIRFMESLDAHTVDFHLVEPHATFLTDLELPIIREQDARRTFATSGSDLPVGAGPYRIISIKPGRIELRANRYWHRGEVLFPKVRMIVVQDDNTRALRMLAGAADLSLNAIPPLLVPLFFNRPEFRVTAAPGVGTTYLGLNTEVAPMNDVRIRRAIAYAIDRKSIIKGKFGGRARVARSWIAPGHWAYGDRTSYYDYDPKKARELLREAGLSTSETKSRTRLTLRIGNDRFRHSIARVIAAMLSDVGIDIDIRPTEVAMLIADLNHGHFQLTMLQVPEVIEPHTLSWFFASDKIPIPGRVEGANRWRFRNEKLDEALERGRRFHDREQRVIVYRQVQEILAQQLPVIPLWHEDSVAIANRRAWNYTVPRDGRFGTLARR
ncbi:MAG: ABC transporter substrate-binding protein [Deltaproteobacteria bacterium]|nr:ABC transporter substrate-binding protein [Deltaproteobacteria bacterium]